MDARVLYLLLIVYFVEVKIFRIFIKLFLQYLLKLIVVAISGFNILNVVRRHIVLIVIH
jgi:hypothetical protein